MSYAGTLLQLPLNTYGAQWGPPLVSTFIAAIIYGISVLQTFCCYMHYGAHDRITWKALVAAIFVLDTIAMFLTMYCMYYYLALSWGMPEMLTLNIKEFPAEYILTTILTFLVQAYYINIVRALRAPKLVTGALFVTCLLALCASFILPAVQLRLVNIQAIIKDPVNRLAFYLARGSALACDVWISVVLSLLFWKRRTGKRQTNNMIKTFILYSVQRGIFQAILQAGELIAYAVRPHDIYFLPFHIIVSRIYCTSLLATLNTREYVASRGELTLERMQRRREGRRVSVAKSDLETGEAGNSWISTLRLSHGMRPVLSSFIDPPFLLMTSAGDSALGVHATAYDVTDDPRLQPGVEINIDVSEDTENMDLCSQSSVKPHIPPGIPLTCTNLLRRSTPAELVPSPISQNPTLIPDSEVEERRASMDQATEKGMCVADFRHSSP